MFAVIQTGGKQYTVQEGDTIRVEKITTEEGKEHTFDSVLLVASPDGKTTTIGMPQVKGATVKATVLKQGRARKVLVKKFKAKVRYTRTYGHRQPFTELKITTISA